MGMADCLYVYFIVVWYGSNLDYISCHPPPPPPPPPPPENHPPDIVLSDGTITSTICFKVAYNCQSNELENSKYGQKIGQK